jgi:hypothetical protein
VRLDASVMADLGERGYRRPSALLNSEWRGLCARAEANASAAAWRLVDHDGRALGSLAEVLGACGDDRTVPDALADVVLASVIGQAVLGDRLAARVVLQRVTPALMRRAARRSMATGTAVADVFDDFVGAAWVVICEYPLERRPAKIAVNVIRDAEKALFGYKASRPFRHELLTTADRLEASAARLDDQSSPYRMPVERVVELVLARATNGGVSEHAIELLLEIHVQGRHRWRIARDRGVSTRTIAKWRLAAERQVREVIGGGGEWSVG